VLDSCTDSAPIKDARPGKPRELHLERENQVKPIKMFGLAALAALMAMAFIGASSAMAESTDLCPAEIGDGCQPFSHVHETTTIKAILLASPEIQCDVLFLGEVTGGAPAIVEGNFTYSNCGASCSVEEVGGPSVIEVLKEGHETSKVTGEGEVHVNCFGINCYFNGEELVGTGKGPLLSTAANGEVNISGQKVKKVKGIFCPAEGKLDINTTPLTATYIVTGLHYCVEYEHNTNGLYENSTCTARVTGKPFDLVIGPPGGKVGETRCIRVGTTGGLWKKLTGTPGVCEEDAATLSSGSYEWGKIKTVLD